MRFLNPRVHGVVDYVFIAILASAPSLLQFGGMAQILCYVSAVAVFGMIMFTRYPFGVIKKIPFTVHGGLEFVSSMALVSTPWLLGFADVPMARNFYIAAGILLFAVWMCTDYKAADEIDLSEKVSQEKDRLTSVR